MAKRYKIVGQRLVAHLLHAKVRRDTLKTVLANLQPREVVATDVQDPIVSSRRHL